MREKTANEYLFEIVSFLITSAERCLGPELAYGPCRLVQTLYMLSSLPDYVQELEENELLMKVRAYVDTDLQNFWRGPQLKQFVQELCSDLSKKLKKLEV